MKGLEQRQHALGIVEGPAHVSVGHHVDTIADSFPNRAYQGDIVLHACRAIRGPPAETQLHGLVAFIFVPLGLGGQFAQLDAIKPAGVDRNSRLGFPTQQPVHRLFGRLAKEVPQRDVDCADRCHPDSLSAERHRFSIHVLPKELNVPRVGSDQNWLQVKVNHLLGDWRRQRRVADAHMTIVGENLNHEPAVKRKRRHGSLA